MSSAPIAILDIDGTLVDSNYQHTRSWAHAFAQYGYVVENWKLHRAIGMGGDQLIETVTSEQVEAEHGDEIRAAESVLYMELIHEVELLPGARELIAALADGGTRVVLASSAKEPELKHYLGLLDADDVIYAATSSADVDATKPEPDLVQVAIDKADSDGPAVMVGDSVWDCRAAKKAGVPTIGLLTGGFGEQELLEAGAEVVFRSAQDLRNHLSETRLGAASRQTA
jgi:HAD superfamily hydrolase (TIGR01549 family)